MCVAFRPASPASADEGRSLRLRRAIVLAARRQTAEVMVLFARNIVRLIVIPMLLSSPLRSGGNENPKNPNHHHLRYHGLCTWVRTMITAQIKSIAVVYFDNWHNI